MSKRKPRKRESRPSRGLRWRRQPQVDLHQTFQQVDRLIERGRAREAIGLLEPLLASFPRVADLHYYLSYAYVEASDTWRGLAGYERALELSRDLSYWLPLASLYLELELNAHALQAFRQVLEQQFDDPPPEKTRRVVAMLESEIAKTADSLRIPMEQMQRGLFYLEEGSTIRTT